MIAWVGFQQATVAFEQLPRPAGVSKWTTAKKIRLWSTRSSSSRPRRS